MSFTPEDAADMVEELPDGTFGLSPEITKGWGGMLEDATFPNHQQAIQAVLLMRHSYHKGYIDALRQIREVLGIRI